MLAYGVAEHVKCRIRFAAAIGVIKPPPMAADSVYPNHAHARGNMSLLGYLSHVITKSI